MIDDVFVSFSKANNVNSEKQTLCNKFLTNS